MFRTIQGQIEAVGNYQVFDSVNVYSYIRIRKDSGEIETLNKVRAFKNVRTYIAPGLSGAFYVTGGDKDYFFAVDAPDRFVSDYETLVEVFNGHRARTILAFFVPVIFLAIGMMGGGDRGSGSGVLGVIGIFGLIPCWGYGFMRFLPLMLNTWPPSTETFEAARKAAATA